MDTYRMLFYFVPVILVLAHTFQSEGQEGPSFDGCYEFNSLASLSINISNLTIESCIETCKMVGQYAYAGVGEGKGCFCGINSRSDSTQIDNTTTRGRTTFSCPCSASENRVITCGGSPEISIFDLLSGPEDPVTPRGQQTTEKLTLTRITESPAYNTIQNVLPGPEDPVTPRGHQTTEKLTSVMTICTNSGVTAAILGTLCGILIIYGVIVSSLLYLSRRTQRSLRSSKEPTDTPKPYTGLDWTNLEGHYYQGIYLSPNGEGNQSSTVQTHSYQEIVTPSTYQNDAVGQVRGRQAAQEARTTAPGDPSDENYVIPELLKCL